MARRGGGRRTYVRDANGRFASTPGGGGGSKRPKARMQQRGPNRLTRDNAGKITSQGGNGATVRGGRLKTASGNLRGRVLAKGIKRPGMQNLKVGGKSVLLARKRGISRAEPLTNGKGTLASRGSLTRAKKNLAANPTPSQRGAVTRANRYAMQSRMKNVGGKQIEPGPGQMRKRPAFERPARWDVKGGPATAKVTPIKPRVPASQRPGSITNTLRSTLRSLAQSDAKRIREIEAITGQPVRAPKKPPAGSGATVRPSGRRSVSGTLRDNLRSLAKSDARYYRELADLTKAPPAKGLKGGKGQGRAIGGQRKALAPAKPATPQRGKGSKARFARTPGTVSKPKGLKPGALAERGGRKAGKPVKKVDTSLSAIKARKKRALTPKNSTYLSQKKEVRSAIVRSAANAIYNRQLRIGKALGTDPAVVRQPIGIMPGLAGSTYRRAIANLENARKRVIRGRRGRR